MRLKALKELRYANIQRFPGDEFDASERDAKILKTIGKATVADEPIQDVEQQEPPKTTYRTRRMRARD